MRAQYFNTAKDILRLTIRFAVAGTAGFAVDAFFLHLLMDVLGLLAARLVSFCIAIVVTWTINRNFAFGGQSSDLPLHKELLRYGLVMLLGGGVNYLAFVALVTGLAWMRAHPIVPLAIGALAGLFINIYVARYAVYRHPTQPRSQTTGRSFRNEP